MEAQYFHPRIKVFIDFWNLQLLTNGSLRMEKVPIDWKEIGEWLAKNGAAVAKIPQFNYEGTNIYTSYNPQRDSKFVDWVDNWLNRQPGIQAFCFERKLKFPPKCPNCHKAIETCPFCGSSMLRTEEKGVDSLIVTDMISLAWENAFDLAVLASSDRDLIPAVKYLSGKGKKVIHAGFGVQGSDLSKSCWAAFDLAPRISEILR